MADSALAWARANRWAVEAALQECGSYAGAARPLTAGRVLSPTGGAWYASSVRNVARRLGLLDTAARGGTGTGQIVQ